MEKVRARVIIEGKVQGVFFRHHTQKTAARFGPTGWVRNRRDGTVEALFEGEMEAVNQIIQWCQQGPPQAKVTGLRQVREAYQGEFKDFTVRY